MSRSRPVDLERALAGLRVHLQGHLDTVEQLVEGLNSQGTPESLELAALLECLLADRLAPAVQDLAVIEESAATGRGEPDEQPS